MKNCSAYSSSFIIPIWGKITHLFLYIQIFYLVMCKKLLIKYVIEFILVIMKKIREKNRSVASGLSVIDFEHGERAEGERAQKELSGRQYRAKRE